MGEALVARYWCYMCSQMVSPIMEVEIKCPFCDSGFVEEMDGREEAEMDSAADLGSDRSLSLWAPILLGMMGSGSSRRRRHRREEEDEDSDQDRDIVTILRRRRRSSAIFRLIQDLEDRIRSEPPDNMDSERERERERDRESLILIDSFNRALILQGSLENNSQGDDLDSNVGASLGDYFLGPGLDLLLQHLAENDPNRYGTPPARKEAVEALPTVKIMENVSCSVCLEDFLIGIEVKEMPCKHFFHSGCILPWLELHSSCPVCRFQLPTEESKDSNGAGNGNRAEGSIGDGAGRGNGNRFLVPVPWPFNELFSSSSGPQSGRGDSSSNPSSSSSGNNPFADE